MKKFLTTLGLAAGISLLSFNGFADLDGQVCKAHIDLSGDGNQFFGFFNERTLGGTGTVECKDTDGKVTKHDIIVEMESSKGIGHGEFTMSAVSADFSLAKGSNISDIYGKYTHVGAHVGFIKGVGSSIRFRGSKKKINLGFTVSKYHAESLTFSVGVSKMVITPKPCDSSITPTGCGDGGCGGDAGDSSSKEGCGDGGCGSDFFGDRLEL